MSQSLTRMCKDGLPGLSFISNSLFFNSRDFLDGLNSKYVSEWGKLPDAKKRGTLNQEVALIGKQRVSGFALVCGDFIEVFQQYETWVSDTPTSSPNEGEKGEKEVAERKDNAVKRAAVRAQKQVRRLVNANRMRYMWTLTLAPLSDENMRLYECIPLCDQRNYDRIRGIWKNFLKRLKRKFEALRWLVVFELHDSAKTSPEKRKTWHLHFATPDFVPVSWICKIWKHGRVDVQDFQKPKPGKAPRSPVNNPGAYMSKYVGKSFDASTFHRKRYSRSRNTVSPRKISLAQLYSQDKTNFHEVFRNERRVKGEKGELVCLNLTYKIQTKENTSCRY